MIRIYRKEPLSVRAIQWSGTNLEEICRYFYSLSYKASWNVEKLIYNLTVRLRNKDILLNVGDWIVCDELCEYWIYEDNQLNSIYYYEMEGKDNGKKSEG